MNTDHLDAGSLENMENSKQKMDYAMTAYTTCSKNLELLKLNMRNMIEEDRTKFDSALKKFDHQEHLAELQRKNKKKLSKIIQIFENDGLSEFFEPITEGEVSVDGLEAFDEKLSEMISRLSDFEQVKAAAMKMKTKIERNHRSIQRLSEEADALGYRFSVAFICSTLSRHLPPNDSLHPVFVLASVLASFTYRKTTSDYYKGVLDKLVKQALALMEAIEKERNPASHISISLATLPSNSSSSSYSLKSTQKSESVSSTILPQPTGLQLSHGEVVVPEDICVPVAKDSQLTMAMKTVPLPVLPNGEIVKQSASDSKVGPKDSIVRAVESADENRNAPQ